MLWILFESTAPLCNVNLSDEVIIKINAQISKVIVISQNREGVARALLRDKS